MALWQQWQRRSIFNANGLRQLYKDRQAVNPTEGNRTNANMVIVSLLIAILMSALFSLMWVQNNESGFLKDQNGVHVFGPADISWSIQQTIPSVCKELKGCAAPASRSHQIFKGIHLSGLELPLADYAASQETFAGRDGTPAMQLLVSAYIDGRTWLQLANGNPLVLNLPTFRFTEADVYLNGRKLRTFYNSEKLAPVFFIDPILGKELAVSPVNLQVSLQIPASLKVLVPTTSDSDLTFLAQQFRYQKFNDLTAAKRTGSGKQLADIARIVLAVFCLLLFIFVDSSPESLGLALFMSFKAVAVALGQNWLPEGWLSSGINEFAKSFLLCFGDIMQFYFFTQLARVCKPTLKPWIIYGGIVAIIYTVLIMLNSKAMGIQWTFQLWKWRNITLGVLCMSVALTSACYLLSQRLFSRSTALMIAFLGTLVQVVYPLMSAFPTIFESEAFRTLYNMFETQTPYAFALSTFINISTLENRVKMLSRQVVTAKEIERELALGQTVQQSFLRLPTVPKTMSIDYFHQAALYVSGDIYFVHWDEREECLTFLINDVTGHGVQAALKASICSTIAESIWTEKQIRLTDNEETRLQSYDLRLHSYLSKVANHPEMISLVGGEFSHKTGIMTLYRANGVFPLAVIWKDNAGPKTGSAMPEEGQNSRAGWKTNVVPLKNRESSAFDLKEGGFIILLSDGLIDTSRRLARLQRHLDLVLGREDLEMDEQQLKAHILSFSDMAMNNDDRTLLVFQYKSPAVQQRLGLNPKKSTAA